VTEKEGAPSEKKRLLWGHGFFYVYLRSGMLMHFVWGVGNEKKTLEEVERIPI
jgi:hypothetical protein